MRNDVAVIILAGGEGKRIGGGKPLKTVRGERLIDRALVQARRWSDRVRVAVRDRAQVDSVPVGLILDADVPGPLGGLISGLKFARETRAPFLLAIPADMPFLPADLLDRLRAAIGEAHCALAASGGHIHPVCGLWRTSALAQVGPYLAGEQRSLRGFASLIGFREVQWSAEPSDPFLNVNTADELAEAERRASD